MKRIIVWVLLLTHVCVNAQIEETPSPVVFDTDTLFLVNHTIGSFTPHDRARAISKRLQQISESNESFKVDSMQVTPAEFGLNIEYCENIVMVVHPFDTIGTGLNIQQVADRNMTLMAQAIVKHHSEWTAKSLTKNAIYAGIAIFIFIVLVILINRSFKWLNHKIDDWVGTKIKNISINNYQLFTPVRMVSVLRLVLRGFRIACILLCFYLVLPFLFSLIPETQQWARMLTSYTLTPLKSIISSFLEFIPDLIRILVVGLVTFYAVKGFKFIATEIERGALNINGFYPDWAQPTFNIIRFLLYAFMLVVIWPYLPGSDSPAFQGVSVFLGLLVSLGSSSAISNMVAGLVITYMRPFKIGDRIKIGEIKGDVTAKTMLVTRIRTIKNEDITVPNSSILSTFSINYSSLVKEGGLILHTTITIGYDAPWRTVHELLIKAAKKTEHILEKPAPFVFQTALNDFYVSYEINAYTEHARGMAGIYSELHQNIQDCFNEGGIEIMSPHYGSIRNGNTTTIPESYRPEGYKPDVFEVRNPKD